MLQKIHPIIISSPRMHASLYMAAFIVEVSMFALIRHNIPHGSDLLLTLVFAVIAATLIGGILALNKGTLFSRTSSASILLLLSAVALSFDRSVIPDAAILLLALVISYAGARPFLHHTPATKPKVIFYGLGIIIIALALAVAYTLGNLYLTRLVIASSL